MKKTIIITVMLSLFASCVREGPDVGRCPLRVTCRDMTARQAENILNVWAGYCSESDRIDMRYLEQIQGGTDRIIPSIDGYSFVYLDPGEAVAKGPVELTAWYTPVINSLTIEYKSLVSRNDIYAPQKVRGIPEGTVIDEDYLLAGGYVPQIDRFFMEYHELTVLPGRSEGVVTVWYNPYYTLTIRYTNYYLDDIRESVTLDNLKRGTNITLDFLAGLGLYQDLMTWQDDQGSHVWRHSDSIPSDDFILEESGILILRYYPSG